jgi:hypothetical protein
VVNPARVAPLEDEDLLRVVQNAFRTLVIPELERRGADEFVLSQVRSCLSIVGFVQRGLHERQVARGRADAELDELLAQRGIDPAEVASPVELHRRLGDDAAFRAILRRRLADELATRTGG